jgi:prefoldin alpha subunit
MEDTNILYQAAMLQKESEESENNLKLIDEQVRELEEFEKGIWAFEKSDSNEIIASMGKGIHVKAKLEEKKLFVEVGAGVVVKKTPAETRKVIEEQIKRFKEARMQILGQLEGYKREFSRLLKEVEKLKEEKMG